MPFALLKVGLYICGTLTNYYWPKYPIKNIRSQFLNHKLTCLQTFAFVIENTLGRYANTIRNRIYISYCCSWESISWRSIMDMGNDQMQNIITFSLWWMLSKAYSNNNRIRWMEMEEGKQTTLIMTMVEVKWDKEQNDKKHEME